VPIGTVQPVATDHNRFISLFPFDDSIKEWVKKNGTIAGHKGKHHLIQLAFDIDNANDLEKTRESTIALIKKLFNEYGLSSDDLFIFFSGSKGFHVCITDKTLGIPAPSVDISERAKLFAIEVSEGIDDVDTSIYENHRLFRVENSLNEKSKLYKIQLSYDELEKFGIEDIKKKATVARTDFVRKKAYRDILNNKNLISVWQKTRISQNSNPDIVYSEGFFSPPVFGDRNNTLFKQAAMIFDKSVLDQKAVLELIRSINGASERPMSDDELTKLVWSAKNKTKLNAKPLELTHEEIVAKSIGEWSKEWYENLIPQDSELTLGFPKFDKEMRGRLRGKLGVILGYGGTKKSLYTKNVAKINAQNSRRSIYSMMEMGVGDTINRFVDMAVNGETENATYALERMEKVDRGGALKAFSEKIAPTYGESILITFNNSMTCEKYDELLEKTINETGKVDILIVDGLSMMGGDRDETKRYSENSQKLKTIANKYNILVLLICHVSKGMDKHSRDISKSIRSSEKIIDNCDFYINLSLIIDPEQSSGDLVEYRQDKGYARLVNKRGSGRSINTIFDFNPIMLEMVEIDEDPASYEVRRKSKSVFDI